jgi:hypothetical protein
MDVGQSSHHFSKIYVLAVSMTLPVCRLRGSFLKKKNKNKKEKGKRKKENGKEKKKIHLPKAID